MKDEFWSTAGLFDLGGLMVIVIMVLQSCGG